MSEENEVDWFGLFGKKPTVLVQYLGPRDIFVIGGSGLLVDLDQIETDVNDEESSELFKKGHGEYVFECHWNAGQYGEFGMCELPPWWDIEEVAFKSYEQGEEER